MRPLSIPILLAAAIVAAPPHLALADAAWSGFANNAQHTAISSFASQPLQTIHWQTPVDLAPQYTGNGSLLIHYASPMITQSNTLILPVKTGPTDGFEIRAFNAATGVLQYTLPTDYSLPASGSWIPSYSAALTPQNRLYFAGAGGTVYYKDAPDSAGAVSGQIAFFGNAEYAANAAAYNNAVRISTPITSDNAGNIFFGYRVNGALPASSPLGASGIARISSTGVGTFVSAATLTGDPTMAHLTLNAAPALSNDGQTLYVTVNNGSSALLAPGYLAALNANTLATQTALSLKDPRNGNNAFLPDFGTASPTIGPDGDVYIGVLENPFPTHNDRGWMLHFNSDLSQTKTPGSFGWDSTASIVPATAVPSYTGTSPYLIMTKYNNYLGINTGDGQNRLAILDPFATQTDAFSTATVMQEILTILGPTLDGFGPGVREWCINTAVVDPATHSILVNNEDGMLYRWDLATNTLSQVVSLNPGIGQAYTPTLIGPDGQVYAINNATLYAVGAIPEPATLALFASAGLLLLRRSNRRR